MTYNNTMQIGMDNKDVTFYGTVTMPSIKLTTARSFTTNLASSTAGSFDGSANVTVGVTGVLPLANGGTDNNLSNATKGSIIYMASDGSGMWYSSVGSSGQLLTSGGSGAPTWTTATNSNTASTVVKRDGSGNFSAGTITATLSGNASTATAWKTARTITLKKGATGSVTIDGSANKDLDVTGISESYLTWGGKNFSGNYGPLDAAMIGRLGADRIAFAKAAGITIEYSTDSGATWSDYGATDAQKLALFGSGGTYATLTIGKNSAGSKSLAPYMLRVTVDTGAAGIYTTLNKFAIYISTNQSSGSYCTIEKALQSTPTTYVTVVEKQGISGWSGWNIINVSGITTYGNTAASQYGRLRFTFGCTGGTSTTSYFGLQVKNIMGFGGMGHTTPSNMATHGHLYNWDSSQNATFPAKVTASSFAGNGASLTALNASNINAGTLAAARLPDSGVTAGTYGLDAAATPSHGGKFLVPKIVVDKTGRVTAAAEYEVTLPADSNTHYTTDIKAGASGTNSNSAATNPYIKVLDNTTYRSQIQLAGSGLTTISSDANGKITVNTSINKSNVTSALGYTPNTPTEVDNKIAAVVNSAPETLNTLKELATALGNDANFSTTVTNLIGTKVGSVDAAGTAPLTLTGSISGGKLTLRGSVANASATAAGIVSTSSQTFAGAKTFVDGLWGASKTGTSSTPFYILPTVPYSLVDSTHTDSTYFQELLKWICKNYSITSAVIQMQVNPNSRGYVHIHFYSTDVVDETTGLPQYASGVYYGLGGGITRFGTNNYVYYCSSSSLTDTKNTAGSSDTSNKIFLIGATSQASSATTYSHNTAYVDTNGHLYSNSKQVVNLSDSQALTNKTYNGYTLAAACAKAVTDSTSASAISTGTSLPTERDIYYGLPTINNSHSYTSSTTIYAPSAGGSSGQYLKAVGATSAPTWASFAALTIKTKDVAGTEATKATYTPATAATATIGPDDLFKIHSYSVTKALSLNTWTDVATAANLGSPVTGTYIIQVTAGSAVYSGVMTWDATTTAVSGLYDEILLHSASTSTAHVTARVNRDSSLRLQLCALDAAVASGTITVKMRRMI